MKNSFILFDFDGVIVDSFRPAFEVNKLICPYLTEDLYKERFEGNINDWIHSTTVHTKDCRHDIDFFSEYVPRMKNEVQVVPGMLEVVAALEQISNLIIISSTTTSPIQEFLREHSLVDYFTQILGNDVHTSKVEKIKLVFDRYSKEAKDCVFITDTLGDLHEANKVGVGGIGVTWGFHTPETLLRGKPFRLAYKPNDLFTTVEDYFKVLK
jgi:phosphoglycolate phosphatase